MKYLLIYAALLTQVLIAADNSLLYRCTGDIFFVMDSSTSIWVEDFNQQLKFVQDLVDTFQIGENEAQVRVGVITFNNEARLEFSFDRYTTREEVKQAISNIKYGTGATNTAAALRLLNNELSPYIGNSNRTLIAVVITDGQSLDSRDTKQEAVKMHELGIKVHAIGVGSRYDMNELRLIASSARNIHEVTSYAALTGIAKFFRDRLCIEETTTQPLTTTPLPTTSTTVPPTTATTTTATFTSTLQRLVTSPSSIIHSLAKKTGAAIDNYAPASEAPISFASVHSAENRESKVHISPSSTDKESHPKSLNMALNDTRESLNPASKNFGNILSSYQLSDEVIKTKDNKTANSPTETGRNEDSDLVPESPGFPILQFQQMKSYQNAKAGEEITTKKTSNLTAYEDDIDDIDFESDLEGDLVGNVAGSAKENTKPKKKPAKPKKNKKSKSKKKRPNKKNKPTPKTLPTASSEVTPGGKMTPNNKTEGRIDETEEIEYVVEPTEPPKKEKKMTVKITKKPKYVTEPPVSEKDVNSDTVLFGFDYLNFGAYRTKMVLKFIGALLPNKTSGHFGVVTNCYLPEDYSIPLSPFSKRRNYNFTKEISIIKPSGTIGVIKRMGDMLYKKGLEEKDVYYRRLIGVLFIDPSITNITPKMLIEANAFKDSGFELFLVSVGKRRWRNLRALVSLSSQPHSRYLLNIPTYQYLVDTVSRSTLLQKVFSIYKRKS